MALTAAQRKSRGQMGAYTRLAHTDHEQLSEASRKGWRTRYERQVDPVGVMTPETRARCARAACAADMARMRYIRAGQVAARKAASALPIDCSWCARDEHRAYVKNATDRICDRHHAELQREIDARRARRSAA